MAEQGYRMIAPKKARVAPPPPALARPAGMAALRDAFGA